MMCNEDFHEGVSNAKADEIMGGCKMKNWLPDMDLNHDKQIQSLLCYRYTIGQTDASHRLDISLRGVKQLICRKSSN